MRSGPLAAAVLLLAATPALAYPTAVVNVPTAGVAPFKGYHVGTYHYLQPNLASTPTSPYLFTGSFLVGVSPYFELAPGVWAGGVELGTDLYFPFPSSLYPVSTPWGTDNAPLMVQPHLKLGVLQETDVLPGFALGAYSFSLPTMDLSANMLHATLTKSVAWRDHDLGQFTAGLYHGNPLALGAGNNGWMAGYYRNLPFNTYVLADYTSGSSAIGGANLALGYSVNQGLSVTAGYFVANQRAQGTLLADKAYLFLDWVGEIPI